MSVVSAEPISRAGAASAVSPPRPFLKWAGGKGALLREIVERFPEAPRRYIEPFLGGGAVFFEVRRRFPRLPCRIGDSNRELIACYLAIKERPSEVIEVLRGHARAHSREHYYETRSARPETLASDAERAGRLIYLNKTCFNGLYRVNRAGDFNVPMGDYKKPRILDEEQIHSVSAALADVEIVAGDFWEICEGAVPQDVIYFDPPYEPVSRSASFTAYTSDGFGQDEQVRLAGLVAHLARRGISVVFSNSDATFTRGLYSKLVPRVQLTTVDCLRTINSRIDRRGSVKELLVWTKGAAEAAASAERAARASRHRRAAKKGRRVAS